MELNEAKTILKNAGYICEKQDKMYNNKKENAIKELSKEIGISINKISESSENYDHYAPDYVLEADLNGEKAVFVIAFGDVGSLGIRKLYDNAESGSLCDSAFHWCQYI